MRAMILAAGLGARLAPITKQLPKPLVSVVGVPNIVRIIQRLVDADVREIAINTHWLPDVLKAALGDGRRWGASIRYSDEPMLLGTGGGIKRALSILGGDAFLVINGDALFAPDLKALVACHMDRGALATLAIRPDPDAERYGAVGIDETGRVRRLVHVGDAALAPAAHMFTGVHVIEPAIGDLLPESGCIVRDTYIPLVRAGAPVYGVPMGGYFCDLGTPERYLEANVALVTGGVRMEGVTPSRTGVYIGERVTLAEDAALSPGTVLCDGVSVGPGVHLCRAVVMPGASVAEDQFDAIVMPDGQALTVA